MRSYKKKDKKDVSQTVKKLSGIIKLPKNFDYKKELEKVISAKYKA